MTMYYPRVAGPPRTKGEIDAEARRMRAQLAVAIVAAHDKRTRKTVAEIERKLNG